MIGQTIYNFKMTCYTKGNLSWERRTQFAEEVVSTYLVKLYTPDELHARLSV